MIMAVPAGILARRFKRKVIISIGIWTMVICVVLMYVIPLDFLTIRLFTLVGNGYYMLSIILMIAGLGWAMINVNSLPMVVDMTEDINVGTYTGLYYLSSQLAATIGPFVFGWAIQFANNDYRLLMAVSPVFLILAFFMMLGVKRGEVKTDTPSTK
jgi:MFS family permease